MKLPQVQRRTVALAAVIAALLVLFGYAALRFGPFASVAVTVTTVESESIAPALFGIGTVQARYVYRIGPTVAGRVAWSNVHVGDTVKSGQILGGMDAVDLDDRIRAQEAAIKSAEADVRQAQARQVHAQAQAKRYQRLLTVLGTSEETSATKQQELAVANAALAAAREDVSRVRAELQALRAQRGNLRLIAPVAGLVVARDADPGTTVVAGQAVIEVIDPASLWVDTRFDQVNAEALVAGLGARIVLRSRPGRSLEGRVLRVEPLADAVTEETRAKIVFDKQPAPLPPLGELAEVTVQQAALPAAPTIPDAAIRSAAGTRGVWKLTDGGIAFIPVALGRSDLDGRVQVREGLVAGDRIVVYSEKALTARSRIHVVEHLPGTAP